MKKSLFFAMATVLLTGCASDELVDVSVPNTGTSHSDIRFTTNQKNITRAKRLNETGHYNFGVFAYKSTEAVNNIMANYLVGYMDEEAKKGYYMSTSNQTTLGDVPGAENGASMWAYERMGKSEYAYTGEEGYYKSSDIKYMSNVENQYLRYWDLAAATTTFYAYAPYINNADVAKQVAYDNSTNVMTFPDGSIEAGYDNPTDCEYMYAVTQVAKADYGKDVELQFKRLNAKVNIKFWEDIDGYSVRILNLSETYDKGVYAKPAKAVNTPHDYDVTNLYVKEGVAINFSDLANITVSQNATADEDKSQECLYFAAPTDAEIGTTRLLASSSATTYYAVPQPSTSDAGLTFHVSYELTSTTGEKIVVNNATVHVPVDNVKWAANTHYTYVFKITKGTNGSTDSNPDINPDDPDVPVEPGLYPIIFDNCTVVDYDVVESDYTISDPTNEVNYSVVLDKTTIDANATTPGSVTATLKEDGVDVTSPAGTWSISPATATGMTFSGGVATFTTGATAGIYTITYTPTSAEHAPATSYSAQFEVIGTNALILSTTEIGTGGLAATQLTVTTKVNGTAASPTVEQLSITYPAGLTAEQKSKVNITSVSDPTTIQVEKDAVPGVYTLNYKTQEGTAQAFFTVVNYGLTLSTYVINHNNTDQTITLTTNGGVASLGGTYTGISLTGTTITVTKTTAEGTYTVKNTVNKNGSVTVYEKTFIVKNVYVLTLDKQTIDNDGDATARTITISASKNAVAETTLANVKMFDPEGNDVTLPTTGLTYEVPATAMTGTYKVQFLDGTTVKVEKVFLYQD